MHTLFKKICGKAKKFFGVTNVPRIDVYIREADLFHEREVYYNMLLQPDFIDLCTVYNFLPENKHEGNGWWERVELVKQVGLSEQEVRKVTEPVYTGGRLWTYVPKEVLDDLGKAPNRAIGFAPKNEDAHDPRTRIVWFNLEP